MCWIAATREVRTASDGTLGWSVLTTGEHPFPRPLARTFDTEHRRGALPHSATCRPWLAGLPTPRADGHEGRRVDARTLGDVSSCRVASTTLLATVAGPANPSARRHAIRLRAPLRFDGSCSRFTSSVSSTIAGNRPRIKLRNSSSETTLSARWRAGDVDRVVAAFFNVGPQALC